ncbi:MULTISPECIES: class B sortase [unclassified Neglectibacter]|uniref:class B sortase n=1 Tax=unclassified Neglectibacter TaxID=2632164 RepID=UPI001EF062A3|nr:MULTISPECIES: class B sortase [unclassified Neglectibacter]
MKRKIFFGLLVLALIMAAAVSAWQIYVPLQEDAESVRAYEDLMACVSLPEISLPSEPQERSHPETSAPEGQMEQPGSALPLVDFDALRAINPDVTGWLIIDGTNINYPVVQGTDNQYYLRHLFTGEYNASGCIFLDSRNTRDFTDRHSILYGHHMGNGTIFNGLMDYKEQAFYDAHPTALLLAPTGNYKIEFLSGYVASIRAEAWQVEFGSEGEFAEWLQVAKATSLFQSEVVPSSGDKVLTLSTCSYEFENARFVLHGVLNNLS